MKSLSRAHYIWSGSLGGKQAKGFRIRRSSDVGRKRHVALVWVPRIHLRSLSWAVFFFASFYLLLTVMLILQSARALVHRNWFAVRSNWNVSDFCERHFRGASNRKCNGKCIFVHFHGRACGWVKSIITSPWGVSDERDPVAVLNNRKPIGLRHD